LYGGSPYDVKFQLESELGSGTVISEDNNEGVPWSASSPYRGRTSSMIGNIARSFDSLFRCAVGPGCLRFATLGGEVALGGVVEGGDSPAHSVDSEVYKAPFVPGSQDVILLVAEEGGESLRSRSGVVPAMGLADELGALVMMDRGARILNILSFAWGGPYESNGSGTD
jgi:hypothetical protein